MHILPTGRPIGGKNAADRTLTMTQRNEKATALVLMDLQRGILETYADTAFLERIRRTIDAARAWCCRP